LKNEEEKKQLQPSGMYSTVIILPANHRPFSEAKAAEAEEICSNLT